MPVDLSIIILNYRTPELTLQCIRSIYEYGPACDYEILVVDNGSEDCLEEQITAAFPQVRFIEMGDNTGYSKANNLGVYNAHGEFIVFLNSDTRLIENCFDVMVGYLKEFRALGVVGPRQVNGAGQYQLSCGKFPTFFSEIVRRIWHYRLSINDERIRDYLDNKHASRTRVDWVSGSSLMVRREALGQAGLFDESFFMYFEDIDLCRRVSEKGWLIHYLAETSLVHYGGVSVRQNLLKVLIEYRRSQMYFARKYYGWVGEGVIRALLFFKYVFHLIKFSVRLVLNKIFGGDTVIPYTHALLAKKVVGIIFRPLRFRTLEPRLGSEKRALSEIVPAGT